MARKRYDEKVNGSIRKRTRHNKGGSVHVLYELRFSLGKDESGKERRISETFRTEREALLRRKELNAVWSKAKSEHWSDAHLMEVLYPAKCNPVNPEVTVKLTDNSKEITEKAVKTTDNGGYTVDAWFEKWVTTYFRGAESTRRKYRDDYRRYISPKIGNIAISRILSLDIQEMINDWQNPEKAINKPLSNKYVSDMHSMLKTCFSAATANNLIASNPCGNTKLMEDTKEEKANKKIELTREQIKELLSVLRYAPHNRFYLFSAFFGLRVMENLGLTINDIDMENKVINLRYQLRKDFNEPPNRRYNETKHFKALKDKDPRKIYFDEEVAAILREQIAHEKLKKKRLGDRWPSEELERGDLLFSNDDGYYLSYSTIRDCFYRRARKVVPGIRIHDLRHIYVTIANESNIPMNEISRHVGHDDVKITQKVYLSIPVETQRESAAKVGKTIAEFLNDTNYNDKNAE